MVIAGIVAGGIGERMGDTKFPKQFLDLCGKPILIHTVEKFIICPEIDAVVIGVHKDWVDFTQNIINKFITNNEKVVVTEGDISRNGTIKKIIDKANSLWEIDDNSIFVTHDAVRPFISLRIIRDNIKAAMQYGVCDTVFSATDTIVQSSDNTFITDIPIRSQMYQGQTPQSFTYGAFCQVYDSMTEAELNIVTDACKMFYLRNYNVYLVNGDVSNFKITYPFDLKMAKTMLGEVKNDCDQL